MAAVPAKKMDVPQKMADPIAEKAKAKSVAEQEEPSWKKYLRRAEEKNKMRQESTEEAATSSQKETSFQPLRKNLFPPCRVTRRLPGNWLP